MSFSGKTDVLMMLPPRPEVVFLSGIFGGGGGGGENWFGLVWFGLFSLVWFWDRILLGSLGLP